MTNADLRHFFRRYNRLYFDDLLPRMKVHYGVCNEDGLLAQTKWKNGRPVEIVISRKISEYTFNTTTCLTLFHEMVHVKIGKEVPCGVRAIEHNYEMLRLARSGAFNGLW